MLMSKGSIKTLGWLNKCQHHFYCPYWGWVDGGMSDWGRPRRPEVPRGRDPRAGGGRAPCRYVTSGPNGPARGEREREAAHAQWEGGGGGPGGSAPPAPAGVGGARGSARARPAEPQGWPAGLRNPSPPRCRSCSAAGSNMPFDLRRFDIYRKVPKDLTQPTYTGAIISVCCCLFILFLFLSELTGFIATEIVNELYVDDPDKDSGGKIDVSLNISLPNLHCDCCSPFPPVSSVGPETLAPSISPVWWGWTSRMRWEDTKWDTLITR
uniref:Endoplasmic reticulum-Golgi intermediate compartment protein n=1 Tax=Ornithorhynchus anatinus TaxID=9258 RepID=A0A6I8NQP4_ORNAN